MISTPDADTHFFRKRCGEKTESPIEFMLLRGIDKYFQRTEIDVRPQVWIKTDKGSFRVDFIVTIGSFRLGFECDGKAFHDYERDLLRDVLILGTGEIDAMWRIRGCEIFYR